VSLGLHVINLDPLEAGDADDQEKVEVNEILGVSPSLFLWVHAGVH
jgi:hypothetical protein